MDNLRLVIKEENDYKLTRIGVSFFVNEIISKSNENILKNYVYVDSCRIIA